MRVAESNTFRSADGTELYYRHWPATVPATCNADEPKALVLLHRGHEHSGRLQYLVDELQLPDYSVFAWDARGHGRSPGARGYADDVAMLAQDLQQFTEHISAMHGIKAQQLAVIAQSVGAVIAACWVHDYAPPIRSMVLAAPAFSVKLYIPFALPALRLAQRLFGNVTVQSYVKAKYLSRDAARIQDFNQDPLIARAIASRLLIDLNDTSRRLIADAAAISVPTQVLVSGADWVVRPEVQRAFFDRLGSTEKELHCFPGFFHDTLGEKDRHLAIEQARRFVVASFSRPAQPVLLRDADREGFTREEFVRLSTPLPPWRPSAWTHGLMRAALRAGALLSEGLRLGFHTGFDSGASLDYVYRNQARGRMGVGRLVDRAYLNSPGWRGIRVRREHLQSLLEVAIDRTLQQGQPVNILDVAAGHGRYVLDVLQRRRRDVKVAVLRDWCPHNVHRGAEHAKARGLDAIARFEQADAFRPPPLRAPTTFSTVAIVSGLYELFPDNGPVGESLAGIAGTVAPRGYLIYTGQPWHPQLELIARTLPSHRGQPWVMRRRTQAELDQLVESAGFRKVHQLTDRWGMFTVSLAQRIGS